MIELVKDKYYTDIDSFDNYPLKTKGYSTDKESGEKIVVYNIVEHCACLGSMSNAIRHCINEMRKDGFKAKDQEIITLKEYMEEIKKQDTLTLNELKNITKNIKVEKK